MACKKLWYNLRHQHYHQDTEGLDRSHRQDRSRCRNVCDLALVGQQKLRRECLTSALQLDRAFEPSMQTLPESVDEEENRKLSRHILSKSRRCVTNGLMDIEQTIFHIDPSETREILHQVREPPMGTPENQRLIRELD